MNRLDELIKRMCPTGVEHKTLDDVCLFKKGDSITKKNVTEGDIPVIAGGQKPAYYINKWNRSKDTITVASSGAYSGYVSFWDEPIFVSDAFSINPRGSLDIRYLYHFLKSKQNSIYTMQKGGGVPHVYSVDVARLVIPLPPLRIQEEIAQILDNFTLLTAELTAELTARHSQYEYYRDKLLTFDGDINWVKLEDIAVIKNGSTYKNFNEGTIPVYGTGGIMTYVDTFAYDKPTVLIPRKGSIDKLYYVDEPFWNVDTIFYTEINDELIEPKFLYYFLQTERLENLNIAGGVPSLTQTMLKLVKIPLPPFAEQARIVSILDKFDALVNDLSSGIPAEIEARQKQYEYYRDRLLTFKEKVS